MGVLDIRVLQPGIDYLGQPDGSTGGDGRVWAKPDATSITHANGDVEIQRGPGTILNVVPDCKSDNGTFLQRHCVSREKMEIQFERI